MNSRLLFPVLICLFFMVNCSQQKPMIDLKNIPDPKHSVLVELYTSQG